MLSSLNLSPSYISSPTNAHISEVAFATLPPALHAKGLRNVLASTPDLPPAHRQRLEEQAALLEAGATCRPATMDGVKLPLTPVFLSGVQTRDYALRVSAGGSTAVNLELDSTAPGIVLTGDDAKRLNVKPAVAGQDTAPYLGYVDSMQIGPMQLGRCAVSVVPDAELGHRYSVISTSLFRDFKLHLDWVAKLMTLTPYPGPPVVTAESAPIDAVTPDGEQHWSRALIDENRILVPALVQKHPVGLVMIDTSSTLNMLSPSAATPFKPAMDQTVDVEGVSGNLVRIFFKDGGGETDRSNIVGLNGVAGGKNVPIRRVGDNLTVVFANNQPPDFTLFSFDISAASHTAGLELGGILGYGVLRQFYIDIDYRNGLVNLTYDLGYPLRPTT